MTVKSRRYPLEFGCFTVASYWNPSERLQRSLGLENHHVRDKLLPYVRDTHAAKPLH